ncbi:hypothetical protein [Mycobacterium paragordonae]|uniref:Terminase small subunit n=1 Tax=Mycobacterium paragordonae TaxID=1389713 RepID=A0AAJ1VZ96_9MYCO|nr:hypothetical protein [Mycobacterium paragordonae]MDP7733655.1 hypothetical protein [Mycobacterium paragordonae]
MSKSPGPVPQRSEQTVRRNKPEIPISKVTAIGNVPIPDLDIDNPHPLVTSLYESLRHSAQNKYYEPSDWEYARLTMHLLNDLVWSPGARGAAIKIASINQMLTSLLVTEGDRRRVRMEVERKPAGNGAEVVSIADLYRQRLAGGQ